MPTKSLEDVVLDIIQQGRYRCGIGFGKYPLGILDAVNHLLPLVSDSVKVKEALADFNKRLETL